MNRTRTIVGLLLAVLLTSCIAHRRPPDCERSATPINTEANGRGR